ncbi:hypothetical protein EW145_g2001 [Phellinidium pouzarii]|uniref:NAD-dependent epimerase/dehydratase domain-containing protein n=1 Tax=Phellinidium pouzarii TaxID=167371 RepID=A0A4S4LE46_9AGAM|nr:hypothetical protein EW145_g2001 [Phellinidium pouzarii]
MPAVSAITKVLVSGANGFIAVWVVKDLLEHGYAVRGTVRAESKATHLLNLFKREAASGKFELFIVSDITAPGAFDDAVKGIDAIAHTASPFHYKADDPSEIIDPAVKGTVGILESAMKYAGPQLKRIVVTSSGTAVYEPGATDAKSTGVLNESSWNESSVTEVREKGRAASQWAKYCASKTLAERAAWDFVEKHKSEISWDLTVLNPPYVFGPILHEVVAPDALNSSVAAFYEAIFTNHKTPAELAHTQAGWTDVHDVARGHVLALEVPAAGGELDAVNELKIPGVYAPVGSPGAGEDFQYTTRLDNTKARTVLGLEFRDKRATARDSVHDFCARGWVYTGIKEDESEDYAGMIEIERSKVQSVHA